MIYITGDTHGNQYKWVEQIESVISPADIILVCGDFGVGFWNGRYWSEETFYDFLSEQKYTVLFIDGNHENFDKLYSYPIETWCGGRVHKIRQNVIHLMRGEVYCMEDISIFVMGGGYSIDKYRRTEGISWWFQEMPSEEEYNHAFANPYKAASYGYIDDVIEPRNTRFRVIRAFQSLQTKRVTNPMKKHSNIPL